MAKKKAVSHRMRNLLIGLGGLLGLYTLAGFLVLPWWLARTLPDQLEQRMGWHAEVESIRFNPFAFSLEADTFAARDADGEPVTSFDHLRVNLSFLHLFRGIIGFEEIRLVEPDVRVDLLNDGGINYVRDWRAANPESEDAAAEDASEPGDPLKLYFQQVSLEGGELLFRDFSQEQAAEFRVAPLDLTLNDLATWPREGSDSQYSVMAALGDQVIEWEGDLSITPLYSAGRLKLSGLRYDTAAHFLGPYLPWQLREGTVTLESRYELAGGDSFELITSEGQLTVQQLALALSAQDQEPALSIDSVSVEGIGFDLTGREASIGMVAIEQPSVTAVRKANGEIDWQASLGNRDAVSDESAPEPQASAPFRWSVQGVELTGGQVRWRDQVPDTEADIALNNLTVTLGGLSHHLEEPISYRVSSGLAAGGRFSMAGQLTPTPFTFEGGLSGSDIPLSLVQPYVREQANLELVSGRLALDGNLDLDGQDDPLTGTFSGSAEITGLDTRLSGGGGELVSWELLRLAPVEFNLNPARLEIGTVTLNSPVVNVIRAADGLHNLQQIVNASGSSVESEQNAEPPEGADPGFIFRIGELVLEKGSMAYADRTLEPPFSTAFNNLAGTVTGISNVPPQQGQVAIAGQLAGVAPVRFDGTLGALGTEEPSNLHLTMEDLALPVLSPYFGRYLGYSVDSGKLGLALEYEITGTRLKASNEVILDRMELGAAVASDQAINAPVKLGLALLTDRNGVIDVNLPIQGDLSDPQFSVGQIVMRAFVNLLMKAAASPFSMLGSLAEFAGFSSEELGYVSFVPGTVQLGQDEVEKLSALAAALRDRPELLLNIRGGVASEADALALLKKQMEARGEDVTGDAWAQAQQAWRDGERSLPPEALGRLASDRGVAIRRLLEETHDVSDKQLFLLDPARDAPVDDQGNVTVQFTLDVR
ncbi:DUF748 domain-containing protein [Marinobacter daepoensis]|uniref:DUF748 domain-containing protein n=1 Tax=Marinobacter daepoensis TaxID=262077 RepID=UPI00040FC34D|nr:DUF748 domain-containing protein [Marinobacter daepoensis]